MKIKPIKKNGKKLWMADLGLWRGKRERIFRATKPELEKAVSDRQAKMRQDGERVFNMPAHEMADLYANKLRAQEYGFTVSQCVEYMIATGDPLKLTKLDFAVDACVTAKKESGKRPTYVRKFKSHLTSLKLALPENPGCHKITQQEIEAWAWRGENDQFGRPTRVKAVSARSRIIDIGTFFSFCLKRRWVLKNPVDNIEPILLEKKPPGIHTVEEAEQLLRRCLDHKDGRKVLCYVALGLFGGLRPAEALRLKPGDIGESLIDVEGDKAKTRQRRLVPINDTLKAWLAVSAIPRQKNFHRDFERVKEGLPWPHDVLRHSFCSYALPKYGATKTAEWAGHSESILFAHYRERVKPDEVEKYWALRPNNCQFFGKPTEP